MLNLFKFIFQVSRNYKLTYWLIIGNNVRFNNKKDYSPCKYLVENILKNEK